MATRRRPPTRHSLLPEARHLILPKGVKTSGFPAADNTCRKIGLVFDPWQCDLNRCVLGKDRYGNYAADTVVISIPRQVGKTWDVGALVFADSIIHPGTTTVWTAHRFKVARETFDALKAVATSPELAPHIDPDEITTAAGNEQIRFRNGSRIVFAARERGAIRGFTKVRRLILDEAQILTERALADLAPTMNQATNPQIILMGTPPKPTDPGEVFTRLRHEALEGESEGVLYVEFSAEQGADPDDRAQWAKANPSYPKRTSAKAIMRLRKLLSFDDFQREALGVWDEDARGKLFDLAAWGKLTNLKAKAPRGSWVLSLDVNPWRTAAAVGVTGNGRNGKPLVFVHTFHELGDVVPFLARQVSKRSVAEIALHPQGQAGALLPDLKEAGLDKLVENLNTTHLGQACAGLIQAVRDGTLEHAGQPELADAIAVARTRRYGEAELFDRKRRDDEISPLVAASTALYRHGLRRSKPSSFR